MVGCLVLLEGGLVLVDLEQATRRRAVLEYDDIEAFAAASVRLLRAFASISSTNRSKRSGSISRSAITTCRIGLFPRLRGGIHRRRHTRSSPKSRLQRGVSDQRDWKWRAPSRPRSARVRHDAVDRPARDRNCDVHGSERPLVLPTTAAANEISPGTSPDWKRVALRPDLLELVDDRTDLDGREVGEALHVERCRSRFPSLSGRAARKARPGAVQYIGRRAPTTRSTEIRWMLGRRAT